MPSCCAEPQFEGVSSEYRRALLTIIVINGVMFVIEISAGFLSGSQALKADALDFGGDTVTYALSLFAVGASLKTRARASLIKGASLAAIALGVLVMTAMHVFNNATPHAGTMGSIAFMALAANLASVCILVRWRNGDSNVRSVWLCSRNDAIGNIGVIAASGFVAITGSSWPDLIVAALLAALFLHSSIAITAQAIRELDADRNRGHEVQETSS